VPPIERGRSSAAATASAKEVGRTTQFGFEPRPAAAPKKTEQKAEQKADKADKTKPVRAPAASRPPVRQAPIWTYIGVGFAFGLVLLGIYQLVGRLAH